jgi:hypothetical protein
MATSALVKTLASKNNFTALRDLIEDGHDVQEIYRAILSNDDFPNKFNFLQKLIDVYGVDIQV